MDPVDGAFDTSEHLLTNKGFLPVPILITEPAVGYGAGAALVFFHAQEEHRKKIDLDDPNAMVKRPPSASVVGGALTENGTRVGFGGHFGSWRDDRIRYLGALARASVNLQFYSRGDNPVLGASPAKFNMDGWYLLQEVKFRLGDSDFFLGGRFDYLTTENRFDLGSEIPGIPDPQLDSTLGSLGVVVNHDTRDNLFSPTKGHYGELQISRYAPAFGSDFEFTRTRLRSLSYWQPGKDFFLGVRLEGEFADGDVPFYQLPYIQLRGIRAMRYQGNLVVVGELEGRYAINPRWSLIGFVGAGRAADSVDELQDAKTHSSVGGGFRYLLARRLGLLGGIDVARGPEEWAFYIQVGQAWN